jgi:hypothetical protein
MTAHQHRHPAGSASTPFVPAVQGCETNRTGTAADSDGGTTGIGTNHTVPVPVQGRVNDVGSFFDLS